MKEQPHPQDWGTEGRGWVDENLGLRGRSHRVGTQASEDGGTAQLQTPQQLRGATLGLEVIGLVLRQEIGTSCHFHDEETRFGVTLTGTRSQQEGEYCFF